MRPWLIAFFLATPLAVEAQTAPSFDCTRARLPTEIMVCRDETLARLDVTMAEMFFDGFAFLREHRPDEAQAYREKQLLWQRWRNTCEDDPSCLTRRYKARILDFNPVHVFETGFPEADGDGNRTRLNEGRFETLKPDASIEFTSADGRYLGRLLPDGTFIPPPMAVQVGRDGPIEAPPIPPAADDPWLLDLEEELLFVIDSILPPDDHPGYRALHAGAPTPIRVERHITSIGILSR